MFFSEQYLNVPEVKCILYICTQLIELLSKRIANVIN